MNHTRIQRDGNTSKRSELGTGHHVELERWTIVLRMGLVVVPSTLDLAASCEKPVTIGKVNI